MNQEEFLKLYKRSLAEELTAEEKQQLNSFTDGFDLNAHAWNEQLMGEEEAVKQAVLKNIYSQPEFKPKKILPFRVWMAAASIVIALVTFSFYFFVKSPASLAPSPKSNIANMVKPGRPQATLTLADGSVINLNNVKNGIVAKSGQSEINKIKNSLRYKRNNNLEIAGAFNTVSTPNGGEYQIVLEDGTKVWLNATSSLRFPVVFSGTERVVELRGEAYFEVAKNKRRPFKVYAFGAKSDKSMKIEVLGTHFNVSAYAGEDFKTTLAEGSVKVSNGQQNSLVIKPGEQSVLNNLSGALSAKPANLKEALAWKNGLFIFDHENIQSIMKKLSRWYDIEVSYEGKLTNKEFVATISRNENLSAILKMLELTGTVNFDVKGKHVVVK
ncbi:MAG TPA: FecR domain-containing protein [Pelobium sp.]